MTGTSPELAIANTRQLIENENVFALIGAVGTPTSRSATPVAAAADVPYVAPFTGAGFLRDDSWTNIINLRASYAQETEEMVERLTNRLGHRAHRGAVPGRLLRPGRILRRAGSAGTT